MLLLTALFASSRLKPDHLLAKRTNCRKSTKLALLLLRHGANARAVDSSGNSVLHYAVQGSSLELVERLLERGARVDVSNQLDVDVLFDAAMNARRRELLLLLLKYDAPDVETRNRRGITALKYLIHRFFTNADAIKALLELGLPVNQPDAETGWTALHYATVMGNFKLVNLLLEYGADVSKKSEIGVTPLCTASGRRKSCITRILVERGASVHECNENDGQYPIHYACSYRSVENVRFLLQRGAKLTVRDKSGATPFSLMKSGPFTESNQIVVKRLAVMSERGETVSNDDLDAVYERPEVQDFYRQCLAEVRRTRETKVIGCISYFNVLDKSFKELAFLARNERFLESFDEGQGENLFPLYFVEMDTALKNAVECRNIVRPREDALYESLWGILPELVLDKIIFYLYVNELH